MRVSARCSIARSRASREGAGGRADGRNHCANRRCRDDSFHRRRCLEPRRVMEWRRRGRMTRSPSPRGSGRATRCVEREAVCRPQECSGRCICRVSLLQVFWLFGTLWALRAAIFIYLQVLLYLPTCTNMGSFYHSFSIHFPQKRCHNDDLSHEIRLRLLSACGSGDAVNVAAQ